MEPIVLIGGGGHCKACIDVIEREGKYKIEGILDENLKPGDKVLGYKIIGKDDIISEVAAKYHNFFITVGQITNMDIRMKLYTKVKKSGGIFSAVISPFAYISEHSEIGEGTIIMHHAVVNTNVTIGEQCIINTKALIEHDSVVGNFSHISTGSILNGGVYVGKNVFIGSNTVVNNNVKITDGVIVPSGYVIRKDINRKGLFHSSIKKRQG